MPTPGALNTEEAFTPPSDESAGDDSSGSSSLGGSGGGGSPAADTMTQKTTKKKVSIEIKKKEKISLKIIAPKIVTAEVGFALDALIAGVVGEENWSGKYVWNMGNGEVIESSNTSNLKYV